MIVFLTTASLSSCEEKWVWDGGDDDRGRGVDRDINLDPESRYQVVENPEPGHNFLVENSYTNGPLYVNNNRPNRPPIRRPPFQRPGGLYGGNNFRPGQSQYGQGDFSEGGDPGILTGPVPSWAQGSRPLREFDACKCTERFNCNTPGISYGHCDVGKKYCCYNRRDVPSPNRPFREHGGVLVGPSGGGGGGGGGHGPFDRPFRRPGHGGYFQRPQGGPPRREGVLVGPGGPFDGVGRQGYGEPVGDIRSAGSGSGEK